MLPQRPTSYVLALITCLQDVADAHGRMYWPHPRLVPGDAQNGFSIARSRNNDECADLPQGPILTPPMAPGKGSIAYEITAAHQGGCIVYLNRETPTSWEQVGSDPTCGVGKSPFNRTIEINLPSGNYKGTIRWNYIANNNGASTSLDEHFNSCADIQVSSSGSNSYINNLSPTLSYEKCIDGKDLYKCIDSINVGFCTGGFWYPMTCAPEKSECSSGSSPQDCVGLDDARSYSATTVDNLVLNVQNVSTTTTTNSSSNVSAHSTDAHTQTSLDDPYQDPYAALETHNSIMSQTTSVYAANKQLSTSQLSLSGLSLSSPTSQSTPAYAAPPNPIQVASSVEPIVETPSPNPVVPQGQCGIPCLVQLPATIFATVSVTQTVLSTTVVTQMTTLFTTLSLTVTNTVTSTFRKTQEKCKPKTLSTASSVAAAKTQLSTSYVAPAPPTSTSTSLVQVVSTKPSVHLVPTPATTPSIIVKYVVPTPITSSVASASRTYAAPPLTLSVLSLSKTPTTTSSILAYAPTYGRKKRENSKTAAESLHVSDDNLTELDAEGFPTSTVGNYVSLTEEAPSLSSKPSTATSRLLPTKGP
ncbi:hypothetical protein BC830DRAFT_1114736 [Chytriomyces sp. MP71]|nr:hypothetical protein BC830DRAFT_1114736 [Chytriomyces sp. MP71]